MTGARPPEVPDGGSLADGIFARTDLGAGRPAPRDFKPWHLPRKQFVRREQGLAQALKVFEERADQLPVKYLGLPGVDLLDLRYLHQHACMPLGRQLRFLGFNSEAASSRDAGIDLNTSLDEVTRLEGVDSQSEIIHDDFRALAHANSIARRKARVLGPFDLVNLDLCDGIAGDDPGTQGTLYDAIAALMALQVRSPYPWTLLVTSRIGRAQFHDDALSKLLDRYNANLATCKQFAEECAGLLGVSDPASVDPASCAEPLFLRVALVALCKWLLALGQIQSPNRVELASCLGYRVHDGAPCEDLVSFALTFRPVIQAPADALQADAVGQIDECSEAARIARRAGKLKDVDSIVAGDAALADQLVTETADLLQAARYDPDQYRSWVAST